MTLEALFNNVALYRIPIIFILIASPSITYLACYFIPGKKEEPYLLSINLSISMVSMLMLSGYLAYVTNTSGWQKVIKQADVLLLFLPRGFFVYCLLPPQLRHLFSLFFVLLFLAFNLFLFVRFGSFLLLPNLVGPM